MLGLSQGISLVFLGVNIGLSSICHLKQAAPNLHKCALELHSEKGMVVLFSFKISYALHS